jgi:hypothetical protein
MPALQIILEEPAWPDLHPDVFPQHRIWRADLTAITALPNGMASGATSVMLRIDLPGGTVVLAETSLALLLMATKALSTRHPSPPGTGENAP